MKKIAVIGHFGFDTESLDGQTVKTKILTDALCDYFGKQNVLQIDTYNWKKHPAKFALQVISTVWKADNVLMLPAHNGLRVIAPLLWAARKLRPDCKLHYSVIGGWIPQVLKTKKILEKQLKTFDGIYAETNTMRKVLKEQGFSNIHIMPNCKKLTVLSRGELVYDHQEPYKLCTFSRVMQEKGIEDAVDAVRAVNEHFGRVVYTLDVYGQIDSGQIQWFAELQKGFPGYVRYGGLVPYDKSVEVLKDYFALLFPTRFYTEGIPGTIIDAYAAGVPVICSQWENCVDVLENGVTGIIYPFGDTKNLQNILIKVANCPEEILDKKQQCLDAAKNYSPETIINILIGQMKL